MIAETDPLPVRLDAMAVAIIGAGPPGVDCDPTRVETRKSEQVHEYERST